MEKTNAMQLSVCLVRQAIEGNPWVSHRWALVGLSLGAVPPPANADQVVVSGLSLLLHGDEAEGYLMNVAADEPSLFFMLRPADDADPDGPPTVVEVSANFYEASRWMDSGESVERLPLPAGWAGAIEAFARSNYSPPQKKRGKRYARTGDHRDRPGH
ncbi:MAG: DUF3305 domain-containing protein [Rhodocyclaceae bacterium]|nr:DUF3305 domain-containing protein [Rhodocyclaceae bacterium]